ncbi:Dyp-type peroxidase [Kitasatospora sp. NBC_00070]|uniref:Dyp-type peroxidase n=1 Tax=Kitasatospora sp. NBC_00070 TaxID=2975962 RepID=UPI00324C8783
MNPPTPALRRRTLLAGAAAAVAAPALGAPAAALAPQALPLRTDDRIQGDILADFDCRQRHLLLLTFGRRDAALAWLDRLLPQLATTRQVTSSSPGDSPNAMSLLWTGLSLTHPGLALLADRDPLPAAPADSCATAFRQGAAARAALLGDTGPAAPESWRFGGPAEPPVHAVLTLAANHPGRLAAAVDEQRATATRAGITVSGEQAAAALPGAHAGTEHFGFRDGISQPAVAGFDPPDPKHPDRRPLPAGEFVVGHGRARDRPTGLPAWARDGAFLVVRRLAQDVPGWQAQLDAQLAALHKAGAVPPGADRNWLGARLIGRWPSGAPLTASPDADPGPGAPSTEPISFADDPDGIITPLWSHLRKTNPRDGLVLCPGTRPLPADQLDGHRMLRRGLPYGPRYEPASAAAERGMLFLSYQADLVDQFEFVQRAWTGTPDFPPGRTPRPGTDPLLGPAADIAFETPPPTPGGTPRPHRLYFTPFVRTEGALYAFTPSLPTLRALATGTLDRTPIEP